MCILLFAIPVPFFSLVVVSYRISPAGESTSLVTSRWRRPNPIPSLFTASLSDLGLPMRSDLTLAIRHHLVGCSAGHCSPEQWAICLRWLGPAGSSRSPYHTRHSGFPDVPQAARRSRSVRVRLSGSCSLLSEGIRAPKAPQAGARRREPPLSKRDRQTRRVSTTTILTLIGMLDWSSR
jgi:hypothetical protein